jgi:hypothetical protein
MQVPFFWLGALAAGLLLTAVLALFGVALNLLSRATNEVRGSILPGLVSGFRGWATERGPARPRSSSPRSVESSSPFEDIPLRDGPPLGRVHPHVH